MLPLWFLLIVLTAAAQSFDVISIKSTRSSASDNRYESLCAGGGRFISHGVPLSWEIKWAFGINDYQFDSGRFAWADSFATYDIQAEADHRVSADECRRMVQSLFNDRFKLRLQSVTRVVSAYALTISKNGPKLGEGGKVRINGAIKQSADEREPPNGWTMARLANYLSSVREIARPVLDRTGLRGSYGFSLDYTVTENDDRPSVFTAVQRQLGLRLEAVKAPMEVFVIEHMEKPPAN